ncbi:MAG: hypothetical protein K0Q78_1094 [Cellvibrio sp.]|jgi:hypothetical protein|nr:hypothetical protein [Cellvibrio sp.]
MKKILFFMLFIPAFSHSMEIESGTGLNEELSENLWETSIPYAIARQGQRSIDPNQTVIAFFNLSDSVFSLSSDMKIVKTIKSGRNVDGSWSLASYSEHLNLAGEYLAAANVIAADHGEDALDLSNPLRQVVDRPISYLMSSDENIKQSVGCYENSPLRYGDLEDDGQKELVLLIGKNVIVSSPQSKKVTFSMHYQMDDEMSEATATDLEIVHNKPTDPQYLASSTEDAVRIGKGGLFGAWRSFTKMYVGHYSSETANDIIVWRKLYQSRLVQDPIKGFEKRGDVFVHYKLIDGEYKKQSTESNVVKGWLTAKNLTWKKGYPSKSECTGQEGQFIPEMHDPLLNDPDVLQ